LDADSVTFPCAKKLGIKFNLENDLYRPVPAKRAVVAHTFIDVEGWPLEFWHERPTVDPPAGEKLFIGKIALNAMIKGNDEQTAMGRNRDPRIGLGGKRWRKRLRGGRKSPLPRQKASALFGNRHAARRGGNDGGACPAIIAGSENSDRV